MDSNEIRQLIENKLPGVAALVESDDNVHFQATVIGALFTGMPPLKRHQAVYQALGDKVGREIHALSLQTHTPAEWEEKTGTGAR